MSKIGHLATSAVVAAACVVGHVDANHLALAVGCIAAASAPDFLEFVYGWGSRHGWNERRSLIPHRTLTHSPGLWLLVLLFAMKIPAIAVALPTATLSVPVGMFVAGVSVAALLHIAVDMLSPMGVPLLSPFGSRTSLGWARNSDGRGHHCYKTGTVSEIPIIAAVGVVALVGHGAADLIATHPLSRFFSM